MPIWILLGGYSLTMLDTSRRIVEPLGGPLAAFAAAVTPPRPPGSSRTYDGRSARCDRARLPHATRRCGARRARARGRVPRRADSHIVLREARHVPRVRGSRRAADADEPPRVLARPPPARVAGARTGVLTAARRGRRGHLLVDGLGARRRRLGSDRRLLPFTGALVVGEGSVPSARKLHREAGIAGRAQKRLRQWDARAARPRRPLPRELDAHSRSGQGRVRHRRRDRSSAVHSGCRRAANRWRQAAAPLEPGFFLCVSRLLPYKNVRQVVEAFARLPDQRLVVVGSGPDEAAVRAIATPNVSFTGTVGDDDPAWLYGNAIGLVAASYEDFGITPLEAAAFGLPVAALRWGGFLDTVRDGETGVFFDQPDAEAIRRRGLELLDREWNQAVLHARSRRGSRRSDSRPGCRASSKRSWRRADMLGRS